MNQINQISLADQQASRAKLMSVIDRTISEGEQIKSMFVSRSKHEHSNEHIEAMMMRVIHLTMDYLVVTFTPAEITIMVDRDTDAFTVEFMEKTALRLPDMMKIMTDVFEEFDSDPTKSITLQ